MADTKKDAAWMSQESAASLRRVLPRLEARFRDQVDPVEWDAYVQRLKVHFPRLFEHLHGLYSGRYDFFTIWKAFWRRLPRCGWRGRMS